MKIIVFRVSLPCGHSFCGRLGCRVITDNMDKCGVCIKPIGVEGRRTMYWTPSPKAPEPEEPDQGKNDAAQQERENDAPTLLQKKKLKRFLPILAMLLFVTGTQTNEFVAALTFSASAMLHISDYLE